MGKTAIILGASGFTGGILLDKLIQDARYDKIKLFSRKKLGLTNDKILEWEGDLSNPAEFKNDFVADELFCCIGTTAKKTPDRVAYRNIDFTIPVEAAKLAVENKINTFSVMSSIGADPKSKTFYTKTKGEMENAVLEQKIPHTFILRPSIIGGKRNEKRFGERIGIAVFSFLSPLFIGPLKKYKLIKAERIAEAMVKLANSPIDMQVITSDKIQEIADKKQS